MDEEWNEEKIQKMVCNPIYTGIQPYPRIVSDEQWIASASKLLKSIGREKFLRLMLTELRASMDLSDEVEAGDRRGDDPK